MLLGNWSLLTVPQLRESGDAQQRASSQGRAQHLRRAGSTENSPGPQGCSSVSPVSVRHSLRVWEATDCTGNPRAPGLSPASRTQHSNISLATAWPQTAGQPKPCPSNPHPSSWLLESEANMAMGHSCCFRRGQARRVSWMESIWGTVHSCCGLTLRCHMPAGQHTALVPGVLQMAASPSSSPPSLFSPTLQTCSAWDALCLTAESKSPSELPGVIF